MSLAPGLVSGSDVSEAVRQTLADGLPGLLPNLSRPLPLPSSYALVPTPENVRRVEGVVVAVMTTSLNGGPRETGVGVWRATWSVMVMVFCEDRLQTPALVAPADYAAAIRAVMLADRSLGGFATDVQWLDESASLMGDELTPRLVGTADVEFAVSVDDTTAPRIGAGWPRVPVSTTDVQITARPIYEPLEAP